MSYTITHANGTITMPDPSESPVYSATNDVGIYNFDDGTYAAQQEGKSSEQLVLSGIVITNKVSLLDSIRDVSNNGETVTIAGLNNVYDNTTYKIASIEWSQDEGEMLFYRYVMILQRTQ